MPILDDEKPARAMPPATPGDFISLAQKSVPAFKWFIGAMGIAALAATVLTWGIQIESLIVMASTLVIGGIALISFQWISQLNRTATFGLARFIAWSMALIFVSSLACLFSSAVLDWPWPLKTKITTRIAHRQPAAEKPLEKWISTVTDARKSGAVGPGVPVPATVAKARSEFEQWWVETPLAERKTADRALLFQALALNIHLYRDMEIESKNKSSSLKWCDQTIAFFEEAADQNLLTEALMEKAAVYIDLADISHVNTEQFRQVAQQGDAIVKRASEIAAGPQKADVFRLWSRFYYNLARPKSGNLNENWDNTYLLASYEKISKACGLDGENIKNLSQLTRTTLKVADNPPQVQDPLWTKKIWQAASHLADRWVVVEPTTTVIRDRISPFNVIAVAICEAVERELTEGSPEYLQLHATEFIKKLDETAMPFQRQAITLIIGTALEERYDYDLYYDLSRMLALRMLLLDHIPNGNSDGTFHELLVNMKKAREGATSGQRDAAITSLDNNECFTRLPAACREQIKQVWQ